ncbi:ArnT family glycosyltransferase [Pedobacter frigidisoli]|uniref:ArnT family glycosyltransferase n=1 Tax=Pedobacter frigidisoli TaxID=2530455 RepID=UPI00292D0884|nr:glycosyltransferase family 39 protein [Pedobacter frigidisoli]
MFIHIIGLGEYGFHADELYYIELGKHFEWGYPDISPFVTWVARISEYCFGSSTYGFRILPCFISALTVMLTGYITYYLGGGKLAIIIACSTIICSPAYLATSYLLQPVVFDVFFWTLLTFSIVAYEKTKLQKYLYLAAFALGLGLLNKYSILLYSGLLSFTFFTISFRQFRAVFAKLIRPLLLLMLLITPNLIWQLIHGFPAFHYVYSVGSSMLSFDIPDYLFQLFFFHGAGVAVWSAGFLLLLFNKKTEERGRIWCASFLLLMVLLALLKGKLYYGLGIFPIFFAAGGQCWEILLNRLKKPLGIVFVGMLYLFAVLSLPVVIPVFPVEVCKIYIQHMVKYTRFSRPLRYEDGKTGDIPQFFADMTGWKQFAGAVLEISNSFPCAKGELSILTEDYAIAGALKYYGKAAMPPVISAHNSFLLYSPETLQAHTVLYLTRMSPQKVSNFGINVVCLDQLHHENSHLDGLYIYRISRPNLLLQNKYLDDMRKFYPH